MAAIKQAPQKNAPIIKDGKPLSSESFLTLSPTAWIAFFTVGILIAAVVQVCVYSAMHATTKQTERAWVSLESLDILSGKNAGDRIIVMGLKNSGRTPARIGSANVSVRGPVLPDIAVYDEGTFAYPGFLVAGEVSRWQFAVTSARTELGIVAGAGYFSLTTSAPGDDKKLWIYGRVTYGDDITKDIREYRWARQFDPVRSKQEHVYRFIHENAKDYNRAD